MNLIFLSVYEPASLFMWIFFQKIVLAITSGSLQYSCKSNERQYEGHWTIVMFFCLVSGTKPIRTRTRQNDFVFPLHDIPLRFIF